LVQQVFVCSNGDLKNGDVRIVQHGSLEIGVVRHNDTYYAYRNLCPHQGGPACEGMMIPQVEDVIGEGQIFLGQRFNEDDMHIVCPWHGYEFHLADGVNVADPRLRLKRFDIVERDGGIYVEV
jgi:nitrite reductase (NADH) small subunit